MPKVGMFTYSDPDLHPLVTNPARVLAQTGFEVDVIGYYRCGNTWDLDHGTGIRMIRLNQPGGDFPRGLLQRVNELTDFVLQSVSLAKKERYNLAYGHDVHGFVAAHRVAQALRVPLVYHCHDLVQLEGLGWLDRWVKRYEMRYSKEASAVILPESRRAGVMRQQNELKREPFIVWNCPLKGPRPCYDGIQALFPGEDGYGRRYVVRHGPIWGEGLGYCLEETIQSVPFWPERAHLVLLGFISLGYADRLRNLARQLQVADRLHLVPQVRHNAIFDILSGAHLGLVLYHHPGDINKRFQSTASLKFFDYLRLGIPTLVPDEPGFKELVDKFECGLCVDPTDPMAIGKAVSGLLSNESFHQRLAENAYRAYVERCHYEMQYEPVLQFLKQLL